MLSTGSLPETSPHMATAERDRIITHLLLEWDLKIVAPDNGQSPSKRPPPTNKIEDYARQAFFKINYLSRKDQVVLSSTLKAFEHEARQLQSGWLYKPNADANPPPGSPGRVGSLRTIAEQEELFQCLIRFIDPAYEKLKELERKSMRRKKALSNGIPASVVTPQSASYAEDLDDTPIPFSLGSGSIGNGKAKRRSGGNSGDIDSFKRAKCPPDDSPTKMIIDAVDSIPVTIRSGPSDAWSVISRRPFEQNPNPSPTVDTFKVPSIPDGFYLDGDIQRRVSEKYKSANRSFLSNANTSFSSKVNTSFNSNLSSVFSHESSEESDDSYCTAHTSTADVSFDRKMTLDPNSPIEIDDKDETEYGSTFDVAELEEKPQLSPEDLLRERLQHVFPHLPATMESASLPIRYEVTRVCLFAKVSMSDIDFPDANWYELREYDRLWNYLKKHHKLRNRDFPEKSDRIAWTASLGSFDHGIYGVLLSAKILFNTSQEGPFFNIQLQPLKIEKSHRFSRRFGHDRFFEMSLPDLCGTKVPKFLGLADKSGHGDVCRKIIVEWMTRQKHEFLGISWGAFFLKDAKPRRKKLQMSPEAVDNVASNCIHFFAIDGLGFREIDHLPPKGEIPTKRTSMTVNALVKWLIPFEQNMQQKLPKLFSRIALGLSKTWKTVELEPCQIRYRRDLLSTDGKEVMNDGCGRLSKRMAMDVADCLRLTCVPSGFQARIGGAKGFWIVDVNDSTDEIWIELYPSQIKWKTDIHDSTHGEGDHRTFEVVDWVKPPQSASLNLQFLPILEDRGEDRLAMRNAISRLLEDGLRYEMEKQLTAMDSPQLFRKWVRENSGLEERLKHGQVQYKAGLPNLLEEQINLLLDNGFDPKYLQFLKDLALKAFKMKCNILKRKMNITVGRSTYAYMAVDFTGILEPDEVHLGFSTKFRDEHSGFDEVVLDGMDILVARSPAHFVSDIQRVKAVWKRELKSLKDVVVFSSKGTYPLAKKLSGGDYDGDTAWICFEPTVVNLFINKDVPPDQGLIRRLGYIETDQTEYSELVAKHADPIPKFLQYGFEFNLHQNLLGFCTVFKEKYCYTVNSVNNYEAIFLSTLLSDLVDQNKQGHIFTEDSWSDIKKSIIKTKVKEPEYKHDEYEGNGKPQHIIDHLKFIVAKKTVDETLKAFHQNLKAAQYWDKDLVELSDWAREHAKESTEWKILLDRLREDILPLKLMWERHFNRQGSPGPLANFGPFVNDLYDKWQAIQPAVDTPLSQALAPSCLIYQDHSYWSLLKASLGFSLSSSRNKAYVSNFIWWMSGKQLAYLKALFSKGITSMTPEMYAMLKPDNTFVKLMHSEEHEPIFWEAKAESVVLNDVEEIEE